MADLIHYTEVRELGAQNARGFVVKQWLTDHHGNKSLTEQASIARQYGFTVGSSDSLIATDFLGIFEMKKAEAV